MNGRTVTVRGEVESIEVGEEIAALAAEVPGVEDVTDETSVAGL